MEDFRQVERVGIVHMGVAKTLPEARMARYLQTPKGLVGMVGITSDGGTEACCPGGAVTYVTAAQLAQVKAMKASIIARRLRSKSRSTCRSRIRQTPSTCSA